MSNQEICALLAPGPKRVEQICEAIRNAPVASTVAECDMREMALELRALALAQSAELTAATARAEQAEAKLPEAERERLEFAGEMDARGEQIGRLEGQLAELRAILDTPETNDFVEAVKRESAHQRARWGSKHDGGKAPADWFWLVGYLAGKALHSQAAGNIEKAKHHTISTAAALCNWHAAILGATGMRPGTIQPEEVTDG